MPFPQNRNNEAQGGLVPPPGQPVRRITTPSIGDGFFVERVDVSARDYVPLTRGFLYSTLKDAKQSIIDLYPPLYFLKETLDPFFYPWALRYWSTDEPAEDTYNAEVTYINENVNYPAFARTYTLRREEYEDSPTRAIGSPLSAIVAVRIDNPGSGYTKDDVVVFSVGGAEAKLVVDEDGAIINVVLTNEGTSTNPSISVTSDTGSGAALSPIAQPASAVLTSQKKIEFPDDDPQSQEKVKVLRIYETLPGPWDESTRIDFDGVTVTVNRRRNIAADITTGESLGGGNWTSTTKKGDENSYVADEIKEVRAVPGNTIYTTREDFDGVIVSAGRTLKAISSINSGENVSGPNWTQTTKEPFKDTNLVAIELVETRSVPGNTIFTTRLDPDGVVVGIGRTLKTIGSITSGDNPSSGIWTKTTKEPFKDTALVAIEVVEARGLPGNPIPSVLIGNDLYGAYSNKIIRYSDDITPSVSESGGTLTTVEKKEVSEGVSEEITTVKKWVDEADYSITIPNVIPMWARALIPTRTVSHKVKGIASQPSLGAGEFTRAEKQLDAIFKRVTVEVLNFGSLPISMTNRGLTEKFGGNRTLMIVTLDVEGNQTIDQGLTVLDSKVERLGNGMEVKTTEKAFEDDWPELYGQEYDEGLDVVIPFAEQVIDEGAGIGTAHADIKTEDKWRSRKRTIDISAAEAVLGAYLMAYPSKINISMPDKLVSLTASIESRRGDGAHQETGSVAGYGSYSINLDLSADAVASASIIPEVVPIVKQFYGANIDCMHYVFFLKNPVTATDVLTKINAIIGGSVAAWPKFNPETVTMLIVGGDAKLEVKATSKGSYSQAFDLSSQSSTAGGGTGHSRGKGLTIRRMQIDGVIHDDLTVLGLTSDTVNLAAYCSSEAVGLGPFEYVSELDSVDAFTSPTTFSKTAGATDWPTSGKYNYRNDARPYKYGFVMFHAIVVDASDFPTTP